MQTLQQIEQFKEQAHQTQDLLMKQNLLIQALELAIADQIEEECTSLYGEIAQFDPKDPFVCYQTSLLLKKKNNSNLNQLFLSFLETQAQSDADFQLHHSFVNASVLGNDKGFDMKLRDLSKNDSKIVDWQAYRFIDQGKWRNVQQIFADRIGGDPNQARALAAKEVALLSQKLNADQTQQADFWKQVYQTNKDDIDAQQALIKLYKNLGKFKEYVDVYRKYVEALDEYQSEEKIEALKAIIAVYESGELQSEQVLTDLYGQLFKLNPEDQQVGQQLMDRYGKQRKWSEVISIIEQNMNYVQDQSDKINLLLKSADIYLNQLKKNQEAKEIYQDILEIDPQSESSLLALADIAEKDRNYGDWANYKQRLADLKDQVDDRVQLYKDLAVYADKKLRTPAIAQQFWQGILDLGVEDIQAYGALMPVAEQNKDWEKYCEYAQKFSNLSTETKEKVDILSKSALVFQEKLGQNQQAKALWFEVITLDSENKKAQDALKKVLVADQDWTSLTQLLGDQNKWDELVKLFETQINQSTIDTEKVELSLKAAQVYLNHINQVDKATKLLEKAKDIDSQNREIALLLAPIYEKSQQFIKWASALEVIEQTETDTNNQIQTLVQLLGIYENHQQLPKAFEKAQQILELNGTHVEAWDAVIRLNASLNQWDLAVSVLENAYNQAQSMSSDSELKAFALKIGEIYQSHLNQNESAIQKYELALSFDSESLEILKKLEGAYEAKQDWDMLLVNLDQQRNWIYAHEQEAIDLNFGIESILLKEAIVFEEHQQKNNEAIDCYFRILEQKPEDLSSLNALQRLYTIENHFEGLYDIVQKKINLLTSQGNVPIAEILDLQVILADLEINQLDKIPEALIKLKAMIAQDEKHFATRDLLEKLLTDETYAVDVAQILMPIYEKEENDEALVKCLEMAFADCVEESQRIAYLYKIADVQEHKLAMPALAFNAYARLIQEAPEDEAVVEHLLRFVDALDLWSVFCELIETSIKEISSESLLESRLLLLAKHYEHHLADLDQAISSYQRILLVNQQQQQALIELQRLFSQKGELTQLIEILKQRAQIEEGQTKVDFLTQAAEIYQHQLQDPQEAITLYQEILSITAHKDSTLIALEGLYEQEQSWSELADILKQMKDMPTFSQSLTEIKLGQLYQHRLGELDEALSYYLHVLAIESAHEDWTDRPLLNEVIDILEGYLSLENDQLKVSQKLQPIYEKLQNTQKLLKVYEIQAQRNEESSQKLFFLHKMADLYQSLGLFAEAFEVHLQAFHIDPIDQISVDALDQLAQALSQYQPLIEAYEEEIDQISIPVVELERRIYLAELYCNQVQQYQSAAEQYQKALKIDPRNEQVLKALEQIYQSQNQWFELIDLFNHKISYLNQMSAQKELLFRISQIYAEGLDDTESALGIYEKIGQLDPTDVESMTQQEKILIEQGRWADVVDVLKRKERITADINQKKAIYYLIGSIYADDRLNDMDSAIEAYRGVLALDENDWDALNCLEQIFEQIENWDELKQIYEKELSIVETQDESVGIRFQLARLHRDHFHDAVSALNEYEEILKIYPNHEETLQGLADTLLNRLFDDEKDSQRAILVWTQTLESTGSIDALILALGQILTITDDNQEKAKIWNRIAQIKQDILNDEGAYEALVESLKEVPNDDQCYENLEKTVDRIYLSTESDQIYMHFVQALLEIQNQVQDENDSLICALRLGRLYERLNGVEESIEQFLIVKKINPEHEESLIALDRLYEMTSQWQPLFEIIKDRIALTKQDDQKVDLLFKLAQIAENGLGDVDQAIESYAHILECILDTEDQHDAAIKELRRLFDAHVDQQEIISGLIRMIYVGKEDWASVFHIDQALCALEAEGEDRNQAMKSIANLCLVHLKNDLSALEWFGLALKELPEDEESRIKAVEIAQKLGAYAELLTIYNEARALTQDLDRRIQLSRFMAELYRDHLDMSNLAEQEFRYILDLDINDYLALDALDHLYTAQDRAEELMEILIRKINLCNMMDEYAHEAPALITRLGQLYENQEMNDEAINQYNDLLSIDAENRHALARLEVLYQKTGEFHSLYENYQRQLAIEEGAAKIALQKKMANVSAQELKQIDVAIGLYESVYQEEKDNLDVIHALLSLYEQNEMWRELVGLYEQELVLISGNTDREIEIFSALGQIWDAQLERSEKSLESWEEVLKRDADNLVAHFAKKKIFEDLYDQDQLLTENLTILSLLPQEDERRSDLYRQLGQIYEDRNQVTDAIDAWQKVLASIHADLEAIDHLENIYTEQENWTALADILTLRLQVTEQEDQIALLERLALLYEETLADLAQATAIYQGILERDTLNENAFARLDVLYEKQEQFEALIEHLINRLGLIEDLNQKQEIYQRLASVFEEKLASPENALMALISAFKELPDDEKFGEKLEKLAGESIDQWQGIIVAYEEVIAQLGMQTAQTIPLHLRVAKWYDEVLKRPVDAANHYDVVLFIDSKNISALKALESLFERYQTWDRMALVLEKIVASTEDLDECKQSWLKLAKTREVYLNQIDGAISAYLEVLSINPEELEALKALEKLYNIAQNWRELVAILERENEVLSHVDEKVENLLRIAELREIRLNDSKGAIQSLYDAIDVQPLCVDAMLELERIYRQQQKWEDMQTIYEMLLTARTKTEDQIVTYLKLGKLQLEQLKDEQGAISSYRKVLGLQPTSTEAMAILDQLYRKYESWDDLKSIYERYLTETTQISDQVLIRLALANLTQVIDNDYLKAIEYLEPIVSNEETQNNLETIQVLGRLYAATEQWAACIEQLNREIVILTDRSSKLERYYQIAMIYSQRLDNPTKAKEWLNSLLDSEPNHREALFALKDVYEQMNEWPDMIKALQKIEAVSVDFKEKSACFYEIGSIYSKHLGDNAYGIEFYQKAIDYDPNNTDAAPYLIEFYMRDEKWVKAEPLLESLIKKDNGEDPNRSKGYYYQLGLCAQKLRKEHKALEAYQQAYKLDSTHYPTLQGLSELYLKQENWETAANILQTISIHYGEKLNDQEKVNIYLQQGIAKKKLGDLRRAEDMLSRAVEINPNHLEVLSELIEVLEAREKWDDAIHYRKLRLALQGTPEDQFNEWFKMGERYEAQSKLDDAINAYQEALKIFEQSRRIFSKLLPIFEAKGDWQSTVNLIEHFAEHEADPETKAKYFFTIGVIQKDNLEDTTAAVRSFDKALDAYPKMLKAFQAIEEILTKEKNFERQDRYFRKMLKRANDHQMGDDMICELAKALAEINRTRLRRFDEAIKAFLIALNKKPNDISIRESIAELYETEGQWEKAAIEYKEIIKQDLRKIESFHRLFIVYTNQGKYDEAWCIAQAIYALAPDRLRAEENEFFQKHYQKSLIEIRRNIDKEHWGLIIHSSKSHLLDQLFERLYPYNAPVMEKDFNDFNINKKKHIINETDPIPMNKVIDYISKILKFERPQSYIAPAGVNGLRVMNLNKPAILVGNDVLKGISIQMLTFNLTKLLYMMTSHALMATIDVDYDSRRNRLLMIVYSLMKLANLNVPAFDQGLCNVYNKLTDIDRGSVGQLITEMQKLQGKHIDISLWLQGLDHTGNRLGLLICNDLNAAMSAIRNETSPISRLSVAEKIQSLILYSISDEYFQLRKHFGFAIGSK